VRVFERLFKPRPAAEDGRRLFAAAARQARAPELYLAGGVPDSTEGRFELYALHVVLLLRRLKGEGPQAAETAQALFDSFVRNLDDGLREMGVGDLSMGKKMRRLGAAVYGRLRSYDEALAAAPDQQRLKEVLTRTVYAGRGGPGLDALARYVRRADAALAAEATSELLSGNVPWPELAHAG
jgi:cytochrome b pre-mRNA-processing protein 3